MTARTRLALLFLLGASGCSRPPPSDVSEQGSTSAPPPSAASAVVANVLARELVPDEGSDAGDDLAVIDLVRRDAWDDAWKAIEALPAPKKQRPTWRLLRGRIAMARGDFASAVPALTGLENDLAPIASDIERWRAESQAVAGPFADAAQYFLKQGGAAQFARAALSFDKAAMPKEARDAADRALATKGDVDPSVRALRARLAEADGDRTTAIDDFRFIALRTPTDEEAKGALAGLDRLDPGRPLTTKERLGRAEKLSEAARTDDALIELDRAEKGATPAEMDDIAWARAFAHYRARTRYEKAAVLFGKLAQKHGPRQAEAAFYAARAASRADHDDEAAQGYRSVVQHFPMSSWADEASYLAARLSFLHSSWGEAATGYTAYLKKFRLGKQREAATYEHALALLADGKHAAARPELHALAQSAQGGEAARIRELEGIAALGAGDKAGAVALWTDVARSQPFSWAAIAARARLAKEGETAPPIVEPGDTITAEPLSFQLPAVAALYHRLGLDSEAESYLRAHEREATADARGREKEALCALYGELGRAARLYRIALDGVPVALLNRAPSPSNEWAWRCLFPRPYVDRVTNIETKEGLPPGFVYAIMRQESSYDPQALSRAHAVGLLQLVPDTARRLAAETGRPFEEKWLRVPSYNLDLGGRYLGKTLRAFDGSIPAASAAYNAGPGAVRKWVRRTKVDLDLWVALIPYEETRTYVSRVMSNLARYAYLAGGESKVPSIDLRPLALAKEPSQEDAVDY